MTIASTNPATGVVVKTFTPLTDREIESKLALAKSTFSSYRFLPLEQRGKWMKAAAKILIARKQQLAHLATLEMGKTIKSAVAEVEKCALVCNFYAEKAAEFLADQPIATDAGRSFVRYQPLGPVLAVMPWNFPFWQVFRFAAPALMAGNVGLLKHASNVPQCALAIEEIFLEAGFPEGAFQTLLISGNKVTDLISDQRVMAATLTGSEGAGISLAMAAGKHLKKTVLELGGSDPFIVLNSADIEQAVAVGVTARNINNGQSCVAAKRFILQESIADQFIAKFVEKFKALRVGDPFSQETDIGPLATPAILQELAEQVQRCVEKGAKILAGGNRYGEEGNFYLPTILTNLTADSPAYREEFFGPVALIFRVKNIDEAIALANDSCFGLGASAWTENQAEVERLITEIESGAVFINDMVKSDPMLPFGGIKRSGYGRELSIQGIHEFVNIKTVWVK